MRGGKRKIDLAIAARLRADGKLYKQIATFFGSKNERSVYVALKKAGLWKPPQRTLKIDSAMFTRLFVAGKTYVQIAALMGFNNHQMVEYYARRFGFQRGQGCNQCRNQRRRRDSIRKHIHIMKNLAAQNGGKVPTCTWLIANGYGWSYAAMHQCSQEFEKAGLKFSTTRRKHGHYSNEAIAARRAKHHGMSRTPEYHSYCSAKSRCRNTNNPDWSNYGARGIKFLFASFKDFYAEVGPRPAGMTLDRINNDGNYAPGNVKWSSASEQTNNRRNTRKSGNEQSLNDSNFGRNTRPAL